MTISARTSNLVFDKDFQKSSSKQLKEINNVIKTEFNSNEDLTNDEIDELLAISDTIDNIIDSKINFKNNIYL